MAQNCICTHIYNPVGVGTSSLRDEYHGTRHRAKKESESNKKYFFNQVHSCNMWLHLLLFCLNSLGQYMPLLTLTDGCRNQLESLF